MNSTDLCRRIQIKSPPSFVLTLIACVGMLVPQPVSATILLPMTTDEMVEEADVIVRGEVLDTQSVATSEGFNPAFDLVIPPSSNAPLNSHERARYHIHTVSRLVVIESLAGPVLRHQVLRVRTPGGRIGRQTVQVPGTPVLRPGEETILFLQRVTKGADPLYRIVGFSHGCYAVRQDPQTGESVVVSAASGTPVMETDGTLKPVHPQARLTRATLIDRVRAAAHRKLLRRMNSLRRKPE